MVAPIINIFRTLEEAMYFKNSWINTQFIFSGVQLIPNSSTKYQQVTNTPDGINLEDWTVKVMSLKGVELGDITDSFMVESLTNSPNGKPQFIWSLTNITQDFGWDLIYLKITQSVGETFYSQPFKITAIEEEKTSILTYKYKKSEEYQTIGLTTWFREEDNLQELTTYYEESTKSTVSSELKSNDISKFETQLMPRYLLIQLKKILALPYLYVNFVRAYLYESPEIQNSQSQENFGFLKYILSLNENDTYKEPIASSGDWSSNDWDSNDWLIYEETPVIPTGRKHSNKFSLKYS